MKPLWLGALLRAEGGLAVYTCGKLSAAGGFSQHSGYKSLELDGATRKHS